MNEFVHSKEHVRDFSKRKKIWEIKTGWHCSIIGTCFTLQELRVLARRLRLPSTDTDRKDLKLHSTFVEKAATSSHASKLLNKLLDRKHAAAIRRFRPISSSTELKNTWNEALERGDIPGSYWAAMTHPSMDNATGVIMYGDVHMLSHLAGASNRAGIGNVRRLEQEIAALEDQLSKEKRRHIVQIKKKHTEVDILQNENSSLRLEVLSKKLDQPLKSRNSFSDERQNFIWKIQNLKEDLEKNSIENSSLVATCNELSSDIKILEDEITSLEKELSRIATADEEESKEFNLGGLSILYVGGRPPKINHLRHLVSQWNGQLLYHDGGIERSLDELSRAVAKADAVLFPTDCISHNAALRVKHLCRQSLKPYVPLRTTGIASFVAGIRAGLSRTIKSDIAQSF